MLKEGKEEYRGGTLGGKREQRTEGKKGDVRQGVGESGAGGVGWDGRERGEAWGGAALEAVVSVRQPDVGWRRGLQRRRQWAVLLSRCSVATNTTVGTVRQTGGLQARDAVGKFR